LAMFNNQLTAMQAQLNVMEADQRALVNISEIDVLEDKSRDDVPTFKLAYILKNLGHLPAIVSVRAKIVLYTTDIWGKHQKVCRDGIDEIASKGWVHPDGSKIRYSVFPNDQWPFHLSSALEDDLHGAKTYTPVVIGCVIYQSALSKKFHKSLFYGVISVDSKTSPSPRDMTTPIHRDAQLSNDQHLVVKAISTSDAD
jgi:hypothetical protein